MEKTNRHCLRSERLREDCPGTGLASDLNNQEFSRVEQAASARKTVSLTQTHERMLSLILWKSTLGNTKPLPKNRHAGEDRKAHSLFIHMHCNNLLEQCSFNEQLITVNFQDHYQHLITWDIINTVCCYTQLR